MPRIDPQQLLKTLGVLLSPSGGIKSSDEVVRLVQLMYKFSKKLVSKCIYVQILKATQPDLLEQFLEENGWQLLNAWFAEAIKTQSWAFCIQMIELFAKCPISAGRLKDDVETNQAPRLINQLRNEANLEANIRLLATEVYEKWVRVVSPEKVSKRSLSQDSEETGGSISLLQNMAEEVSESIKKEEKKSDGAPPSKKSRRDDDKKSKGSSKSSKHKNDSISLAKEKEERRRRREKEQEEREKERKRHSRPPFDRRDEVDPEEKKRIKELARKMKEDQARKDKDTLSKIGVGTPTGLSKIPRIPKKPAVPGGADKNKGKSFEDMLGGLDAAKPKTVKTPMNKNKTASLLEGLTKSSPSSKTKPSSKSTSTSSSSDKKEHRHHHHHHSDRHHHHGHGHHHHHSSSKSSSSSKDPSHSKKPEKPLVIPDKKKHQEGDSPKSKSPHNFTDSTGFMNALFGSINKSKEEPRRKKRRLSESEKKSPDSSFSEKPSSNKSPKLESPKTEDPKPVTTTFSFYRDTLETPEEEEKEPIKKVPAKKKDVKPEAANEKENDKENEVEQAKDKDRKSPSKDTKEEEEEEAKEADPPFEEPKSMPREVKGILVYHRGKEKRNKVITWKPESALVDVRYFELDEDERVNVNKIKFENMRAIESKLEKEAVKQKGAISVDEEEVEELKEWTMPIQITVVNRDPFEAGKDSKEKDVQFAREKNVLQALYFNRAMTPATPAEADHESNPYRQEPILIPTDDVDAIKGEDNSNDYVADAWPEPKVNQIDHQADLESTFSLPPALSNLLNSVGDLKSILPTPPGNLTKEEQDTLAAQTQAMQAMGMLPGVDIPPTFPPPMDTSQPPPVPVPPPNGAGFDYGAPPPHMANMPPPPPRFGGPPPPMGMPPPGMPMNGFPPPHPGDFAGRGGFMNGNRGFRGAPAGFRPPVRAEYRPHYDESKYRTKPCVYFNQGNCREGESCRYIHEMK